MARSAEHVCYEFGGFRLDPGRRILCAATTDERLGVPPRVVDIALYFVQRPGELVSKERLLSDIWPGQVVEENNLTQGISQLRRAFGELRGENRYIVTVPRRGYRFVADVVRVTSGEMCCGRAIARSRCCHSQVPAGMSPMRRWLPVSPQAFRTRLPDWPDPGWWRGTQRSPVVV